MAWTCSTQERYKRYGSLDSQEGSEQSGKLDVDGGIY